jgi:hypothetical protein
MDSFPQVVRCVLGQGGGIGWLEEQNSLATYAKRVFGPDSVVATNYGAIRLEPVVFDNLAENTRETP